MKPEVLVWALLFVIATGLIFRAFSQAARRAKRTEGTPAPLLTAPPATEVERAAPTIEAPKPERFVSEPKAAQPLPPSPASASAQPIRPAAPAQISEASPRTLPRFVAATAPAVAIHERTVIATPNVKATLDPTAAATPRAPITPNVRATLPPAAIATSDVPVAVADVKATLPPDPTATSQALLVIPNVGATLPPAPPATPEATVAIADVEEPLPQAAAENAAAETESSEIASPDAEPDPISIPTTILLRGTILRARRLGQAMPPLDERIKETRSRKLRPRSKTRRKRTSLRQQARKAPPLRIIAAPKVGNTFVSARAHTKIVDVPPREPRVRFAYPENAQKIPPNSADFPATPD